jgi:hypothetical protein
MYITDTKTFIDWGSGGCGRQPNARHCEAVCYTACDLPIICSFCSEQQIRMITKPQNAIKTNKTAFWRKSLISLLFQSSVRGPFLFTLLTKSYILGGARGGEYTSPFQIAKTQSFFNICFFGLQNGIELLVNCGPGLGLVANPSLGLVANPSLGMAAMLSN